MAEEFVDNSAEVLSAMELAKKRAMEIIGGKAEGYATKLAPTNSGILARSIEHHVEDDGKKCKVIISSNLFYAPFVEMGTGPFFEKPPSWLEYTSEKGKGIVPWHYKDSKGEWHTCYGMKAQPFIQPAIDEHRDEYKEIMKTELQGD